MTLIGELLIVSANRCQYDANHYIRIHPPFQRLNSWVFLIFGKSKFENYGNNND